jgi:superfamily II DNA or RNA helicase
MKNSRFYKKKPTVVTPIPEYHLTTEYCRKILEECAYIGQQGFTILKEKMDIEDLKQIKSVLTVQTLPSFSGPKTEPVSFPVYRENDKKIYIPRFYGESRYGGIPSKIELSIGDSISVPFIKPIRDYQEKIIQVYIDHIGGKSGGGILEVPCGRGKCLGIDTPILMYDGSVKLVQHIVVGDILMGDDSTPRNVLTLARGIEQMYEIKEKNIFIYGEELIGDNYIVNESHILSLNDISTKKIIDISVQDYLILPKHLQNNLVGYRVPIIFPDNFPEEDAYCIGTNNNAISPKYKYNTTKCRFTVLAGMIDSYGILCTCNLIQITHTNLKWIEDCIFISRSLGLEIYRTNNKKRIVLAINTNISKIPFRKQIFLEFQKKSKSKENHAITYDFSVKKTKIDNYYGFEIDGNRRFVLGDFTVTHNTVMALKIISIIERKTLILVHKEFLMNQWIERIMEFMPSARVGKIQGPKFDIEEKDIVIGMIQSLYDRAFPINTFSSFGLTIVDEVHRIASEEFSKTLSKTITNCMLGISATVDRKDGLTNVLHMFIGPKIYTEERKDEDIIEVRAIEYINTDPEYNEVVYDYMGNVAHTTMISKISNFPPRCHFITRILRDLMIENPEKQIMVLSQIRGLLTVIHEQLIPLGYEVGFYVGGMKQKDLQETEDKQIVLATYAMAAEALDIKTLNTLVMVSPKTDIIQSVGRILRTRGSGKLIIDVVDTHDVFQNQWKKRRAYYKKCGYGIYFIKSSEYINMMENSKWKRIADASCVTEEENRPKCFIDVSQIDFERKIG